MSSTAFPPISPPEPPRVFGAPALHTENELLALGIAADGTLWSVEEPGLLRQWSLATRRQVNQWTLDENATVWAFNWAGRLLVSGSNEVDVWEISSGEQLVGWTTDSWVTALAFQPGAPILATGHDDGLVRVWDWAESKLLHEIRADDTTVSALSFSWDRGKLATAGEDRLIRLWDLNTGKALGQPLAGHTDRIPALAWHLDNRRLFSAGWDTTVRVWDVNTSQPIILLNSHATQVHAIALSGDGKLLASADSSQAVHVWDTDAYRTISVLRDRLGEARVLCFTPDGWGNLSPPLLAFGGVDRIIHLWDSRQSREVADIDPLLARFDVAVSSDGRRLYSIGSGTDLRVWDADSAEPVLSLEDSPVLRAMAVSPDGRLVAGSKFDDTPGENRTTLALYDARSGKRQAVCDGQLSPITTLAFRGDSAVLASGGVQSSDVWLWDVPSGQPRLLIPDAADRCSVEALAFQPGGELLAVAGIDYLATGGSDGETSIWNTSGTRCARTLSIPGGATAIAWSPNGQRLAVANLRRVVRIHDVKDGQMLLELPAQADTITALACSPDGRWLATACDDRTLRLFNAVTGDLAAAWELDNQIKALVFSPDGKWLYTSNGNTSCYQIEVEQLLASGV